MDMLRSSSKQSGKNHIVNLEGDKGKAAVGGIGTLSKVTTSYSKQVENNIIC